MSIPGSRKRKSDTEFIFEVDDDDCSPTPSPRTIEGSTSLSDGEITSQTSNNVSNLGTAMIEESDNTNLEIDGDKTSILDDEMSISEDEPDVCIEANNLNTKVPERPLLTIIFRDKDLALAYRNDLSDYVKNLLDCEVREEFDLTISEMKFWKDDTVVEKPEINADNMFMVDTTPSKNSSGEGMPMYSKRKCEILDPATKETAVEDEKPKLSFVCFNCNGNHLIRDCKEKRDYRKINMARNKMKASKPVRYHLENEQKFAHFAPGKVSDKLKRAMDVRRHEIPGYIYKMRLIGYPPGWLEEAKEQNSCLELFDFQGSSVTSKTSKKYLDASKIVEYSGFNVPLDKHMKDEFMRYRCPPFNKCHSKEAMIDYIDQMYPTTEDTDTVRPALDVTPVAPVGCDLDAQEQEMARQSPSLTELEKRKKQLLAELDDGISNMSSPGTPVAKNISTVSIEDVKTPVSKGSCAKTVVYGTPIVKSSSPYNKLPNPDNFSKDITQVINFENLPDSTGKYEQMSKVIEKVRTVIKTKGDDNSS